MAPEQGLQKNTEGNQAENETNTNMATNNDGKQKIPPSSQDAKGTTRGATPRSKKIKTTWISYLLKSELEGYLRECGMDDTGVVEDLRRRLSTYVSGGHYCTDVARRFSELEARHTPGASTLVIPAVDTLSERPGSEYMSLPDLTVPPYTSNRRDTKTTEHYVEQIVIPQYFGGNPQVNPHNTTVVTYPDIDDRTFDRVRTWGLHFDERADPIDFIDRIEELARSQRVPLDQVPFTLSESFHNTALAWWRNRRHEWTGWESFKQGFLKYFLPVNFWDDLEDSIRRKQQREDESFKGFALELETLMRHTQYSGLQKLERIYKNSLPAIRLLVKRREFETLDELTDLVAHIETTRGPINQRTPFKVTEVTGNLQPRKFIGRPEHVAVNVNNNIKKVTTTSHSISVGETSNVSPTPAKISNPKEACRRCAERGHTSNQCKNPQKIFCWSCGTVGVLTRDCCPHPNTRLNLVHSNKRATQTQKTFKVSTPSSDGRSITCVVKVGYQTFNAILDTGSWHSYIDAKIIKQLPTDAYVREDCGYNVVFANGLQQRTTSSLAITYDFMGKIIKGNVLVLKDSLDSFILGMDFLTTAGATLIFNNAYPQDTETHLGVMRTHPLGTDVEAMLEPEPESLETDEDSPEPVSSPVTSSDPGVEQCRDEPAGLGCEPVVPVTGDREKLATPDIPEEVKAFLEAEVRLFADVQGVANVDLHKITMKDDIPIKKRYYPRNPAQQTIINEKVDELLAKGLIEPSNSPYSAPVVLVRKKNNQWRMRGNYRQRNEKSVTDAYPLPRIHHNLDHLRNTKYISSLDLKDGYWQIAIDPECRKYTAFTVPGRGPFRWKVMPFGLHSAPATFQHTLDDDIGGGLDPNVFVVQNASLSSDDDQLV